jgi:hypothetical protein
LKIINLMIKEAMSKKHFSNIHAQVIAQSLKEFKDIHAITDKGILGIKAGEILYDVITGEYDIEEDVPNVVLSVTAEEKKQLWKEANIGDMMKLFKKEFPEADKERIKAQATRIYKTFLVEHHLNILANNGQFVEINLPLKLL